MKLSRRSKKQEFKKEAINDYHEGKVNIRTICFKYGIAVTTLYRWVNEDMEIK